MKSELPTNMTLEDFEQLADREPNLNEDWIYRLCQISINSTIYEPYPKFDLYNNRDKYFLNYDEAITEIKEIIDKESTEENISDITYCFQIVQIPIGESDEFGACWLFDAVGHLLDYSITTWTGDAFSTAFFGRPDCRNRFKEGDIVEVMSRDEVRLAILLKNPPSPQWCYRLYQRCMADKKFPFYTADASDDCCIVIDGPGYEYHNHVSPLAIMKPRFPIPADLETEMKKWIAIVEAPPKDQDNYRYYHAKGEYVGDFYELRMNIHYGQDAKTPHLHIYDRFGLDIKLRINVPEYFDKEGNTNHRLTDNQKEALMDYLEDVECGRNKWWYLLRQFNDGIDDPQYRISLSTPLPNYRLLK